MIRARAVFVVWLCTAWLCISGAAAWWQSIQQVSISGAAAATSYDPLHTSANINLTNNNLTVEVIGASANGDSSRSIAHHASGLYYNETIIDQAAGTDNVAVGVGNASFNVTNVGLGSDTNGAGYTSDGNIYSGGVSLLNTGVTYTTGDRIGVEVNVTGQTMRVRKNNGAYSSTANLVLITGDLYFVGFVFRNGGTLGKLTTNFGGSAYIDSPGAASNW